MSVDAARAPEGARSADAAHARAHPLTQFGFDALVAGAARPRPGALAFCDHLDGGAAEISYADLYQRAGAFLARLRSFALPRGDRALICCPPGAQSFVAVTAAVAAGLDPILAPLPLPMTRRAVAAAARAQQISAIFSPVSFCGIDFEEPLLSLAAETPSIRIIGALSGRLDGAVDLSAATLETPLSPRSRLSEEWSLEERPLVGAMNDVGAVHYLSQSALLASALEFVRLIRGQGDAPVISLNAPSSLAALIAGPLAALLAGAPLHFIAPFEAGRFLALLDALGPARLVAPAALLPDLAASGLLSSGAVISVAALAPGGARPPGIEHALACPIIEMGADGGAKISRAFDSKFAPAHA
jgi:hypothetical protein